MNKTLKQIPQAEGNSKFVARIEDESCAPASVGSRIRQQAILSTLASTPGLSDCGMLPFQSMKMWHDGTRWVIELEAVGN